MASRRVMRRGNDGRRSRSNATNGVAEEVYGLALPDSLHDAIEDERGRLLKAVSILRCMKISLESSLESETHLADRPYYPDIAEMALALVMQAFNGLDSLNLGNCVVQDQEELVSAKTEC